MQDTPSRPKNRAGRKPRGEEYAGVNPIQVQLPRTLTEALDLKAQYDRYSRSDAVRELLWKAIRMTAATDKRFAELLTRNGIDVAPVNLKPRKDIYKEDPSDLV